jgi:ArsR family transcriptional regulator, arsenate/arsenite/antimonite-responsive transcriptional repressor
MDAEMIDFVKAMSDPERLRIIGALSKGPLDITQVAEATGLSLRDAYNHLAFLEYVHVVLGHAAEKKQDEIYELDAFFLEKLARQQFKGKHPEYTLPPNANEETRRILKKFLKPDGSIRQIPNTRTQYASFQIILNYVLASFETDRIYTEKEINVILKRFHEDVAGLRRDLVDTGMLSRERDGSKYWRTQEEKRPS